MACWLTHLGANRQPSVTSQIAGSQATKYKAQSSKFKVQAQSTKYEAFTYSDPLSAPHRVATNRELQPEVAHPESNQNRITHPDRKARAVQLGPQSRGCLTIAIGPFCSAININALLSDVHLIRYPTDLG